jgi:DNA-binding NarL/FixJ family response regulator
MDKTDRPAALAALAQQSAYGVQAQTLCWWQDESAPADLDSQATSTPGKPALAADRDFAAGRPAMTSPHGGTPSPAEEAKIATLTTGERQVITLVGEGLRNPQIAQRLGICKTTVRHHLSAILTKLGVTGRLELILYAYRHGLAQIPV